MQEKERFYHLLHNQHHYWSFHLGVICLILCGCTHVNQNKTIKNQSIPIIDLSRNYPKRELIIDEIEKVYILLESTNEVLSDEDFHVEYLSDKRIVGCNSRRGDIFIFSTDGKVISYFNHRGSSGIDYTSLNSIVYDENKQEIYIADAPSQNQCVVYSEGGKFLRKFNFPEGSYINSIDNFDEQSLIAYNQYFEPLRDFDQINQKIPYVFLSKKDGSLISRLDISLPTRLTYKYLVTIDNNTVIKMSYPDDIYKNGKEFIIADGSTDSVFLLTQDKNLTPLFIRTPSVFEEKYFMYINFKTDRYLFFYTIPLPPFYDWSEIMAKQIQMLPTTSPIEYFVLDLHTGEIGSVDLTFFHINDAPEKTAVRFYTADQLINSFNDGVLDGTLKEIAQKIDPDDNPVIEIIKYK